MLKLNEKNKNPYIYLNQAGKIAFKIFKVISKVAKKTLKTNIYSGKSCVLTDQDVSFPL